MKPTILLIGAGGHARACIDVIEQHGLFSIAGLVAKADARGTAVLGYPVVGTDDDIMTLLREHRFALIAIGHIRDPSPRVAAYRRVLRSGAELPVVVSPSAYVSPHASVGAGTIIMHGAIVNAAAKVGSNCIINSRALIEHDAIVHDHCHISTAATLNGGAQVGAESFVGSHACIRENAMLGSNCLIGMGQVISGDCPPGTRVPGTGGKP